MRLLRQLTGRRRMDEDLRQELDSHRAELQAAFERRGLTPDAAAAAGRRAMGTPALPREDARDVWIVRWIDDGWREARQAFRALRREPLFASAAIVTLS